MAFLKRLGFYLAGFAIGLVFLAFFFKKKSEETGVYFCYFPNCRTLKDIRSKPLTYSEEVQELLRNNVLDSTDITTFLTEGSVDFSKSDTKTTDCKTYFIDGDFKEKEVVVRVKNCMDKAIVEGISLQAK